MGGIVDELLDHLGDRELVGSLEALGGIGAGLLHVSISGLLDVGDVMALLVLLDVLFDAAEFPFDDVQTVVDEQGGVAHRLVLVLHPFLVVNVEERAKDGFSAGREDVLHGQHHDGGLFRRKTGGQAAAIGFGAIGGVDPRDGDVMGPLFVIGSRIDDDPADRGFHGVRQVAVELVSLELLGTYEEVADDEGAVLPLGDVEGETGSRDLVRESHLDRGVLVHFADPHELVVDVGCLEPQAGNHLLHEIRGAEGLNLVVHIGTGSVPAGSTGEGGQVTHHRVLGVLVHDDFLRATVSLRRLVEVEARNHERRKDAEDIPPFVVPDEGPEVGELQGLLLLGVSVGSIDGKIVLIVF